MDYTLEKARQYVVAAQKNLSIFPTQPHKRALEAMADFVVQRNY